MSLVSLIFVRGGPDQFALRVLDYSPQPWPWGSYSALPYDGYATVKITLICIFHVGLSTVSGDSRPTHWRANRRFSRSRRLSVFPAYDCSRQFRLRRDTGGTLTPSGRDDSGLTPAVDPVEGSRTTMGW